MKKIIVLASLVCGICCCAPKGVSELRVNGHIMYVSSTNDLKADTLTIALSDLVEDCMMVQLESTEAAYIHARTFTITDKYIGVNEQQMKPYKLFDRSGKFLNEIGAIGRGPGEYPGTIWDDIIDDKNDLIYLIPAIGNNKILVYNTSGQFLKDLVAPHPLRMPSLFLHENILTVVHVALGDEAVAIQFDVHTGEIVKEFTASANKTMQGFQDDDMIFSTRNIPHVLDFHSFVNDTLYHYNLKENAALPFFTMASGPSENLMKQYYLLNKDLVLSYLFCGGAEGDNCTKTGLVATDLKHKQSSFIKVVNDYFGNISVPLPFFNNSFRNGYWVHTLAPEDLMAEIESRLAEETCTASDSQALKEILPTLKEGANNVVFIAKLKSELKKLF